MGRNALVTEFASPERCSESEIERHKKLFENLPQFTGFAGYVPDPILVLNRCRQIVYANIAALKIVRTTGLQQPYGLRPGEALRCEHASSSKCGCGTTSFCRYCGAVQAILSSLEGIEAIEECRLSQEGMGEAFLFAVYTYPFKVDTEVFSIFILKDITKERQVDILERVFFHDVRNTLTVLRGWVNVLQDMAGSSETREVSSTLTRISNQLCDEVIAQEQLIAAAGNTLAVNITTVNSLQLLTNLKEAYEGQKITTNRTIIIDGESQQMEFSSDVSLLKRVLGNMLKNALEATKEKEAVVLCCTRAGNKVQFTVHNPGFISPDIQSQIFKWSFSTKGKNRGLGTYGMRLLSERYLRGKISFKSSPTEGTTFVASYPL